MLQRQGIEMNLPLRMYWPNETPPSILDGTWAPRQ